MINSIGDCKNDAVNWCQDQYDLLRHVAEAVVAKAIEDGRIIISENGVFVEDDDGDIKKTVNNVMQRHNKLRFRNHNLKKHKFSNVSTDSDNSAVNLAFDMLDDEDAVS